MSANNGNAGIPRIGPPQEAALTVAQPINDLQLICLMASSEHATQPRREGESDIARTDRIARETLALFASVVVQYQSGENAKAFAQARSRLLSDPREAEDHKTGKTEA